MSEIIYDALDEKYKCPVGAVKQGSGVHFLIVLPREFGCKSARLKVKDRDEDISMFWCGMRGDDHEAWECDFVFEEIGAFFYSFEIENAFGVKQICRAPMSKGKICDDGECFQLTVYKRDFKTPDWLRSGVMYQIFPDRFCRSSEGKNNVPTDRQLRDDWYGMPEYKPNENGIVTNSDYFCGDLKGIEQKLDYLQELGVTCIYLNPIFESHVNHRYATADYMKVDPLLGTEDDFVSLCKKAKELGMKIILDGVFSHTGSDSVYFNRAKRYSSVGAYNSRDSKFYSWYKFQKWPDKYNSWWGFDTLPEVKEIDTGYDDFINGPDGVVAHWIQKGASGWRLDVADELPDAFIKRLRSAAKKCDQDALIIGEVWEDASKKESYGVRREYLLGEELDSVMNYPFREAILNFLKGQSGETTMDAILRIVENYPPQVTNVLMNVLGTHDTVRAITYLMGENMQSSKDIKAISVLSEEQRKHGVKLMKLASLMQYTLPGVPCIYYADEVGLEGYEDPFSRQCYPWGKENILLLDWYKKLGAMRKKVKALSSGKFVPVEVRKNFLMYKRVCEDDQLLCAINISQENVCIDLPKQWMKSTVLMESISISERVCIPSYGASVLFLQM